MRVLVIGGSGFIGTHVVSRLRAHGHEVASFGRRRSADQSGGAQFVGDRQNLRSVASELRAFAPGVVIDLILSSGRHAQELVEVVGGVTPRIVAISSMDVYRACAVLHRLVDGPIDPVPLTESSPLRTKVQAYPVHQIKTLQSVFEWVDDDYDKVEVEREILAGRAVAGTVLRLPMIYGPGDRLHRLAPMLAHMDAGLSDYVLAESIAQWRGPRGYVENVADAIVVAAENERAAGEIYNVAEPDSFSEAEWARRLAYVIDWKGRVVVVPDKDAPANPLLAANLQQHWTADSQKIRRELGYRERVEANEAIRRTALWERAARAKS